MRTTSNVFMRTSAASQWARAEITQLLRFIRQPTCDQQCIEERDWVLRAVYHSLLVVALVAPFAYFINSLQELMGIAESRPAEITKLTTFVSIVFLVPMIEETLFRAGLRNPICSLVLAPVAAMASLINSEQRLLIFATFLLIIVLLTASRWSVFFGHSRVQFEKLYSQKFRMVFWANCLYFGCAHLINFNLSGMQVALCWLVIAPQLVFAVVFSYLRLRNGIKSAILSHAIINLVGLAAFATLAPS